MVPASSLGGRPAAGPARRLRLVALLALLAPFGGYAGQVATENDAASFADGACPDSPDSLLDGPGCGDLPVEPEQQLNQKWGAFSWGAKQQLDQNWGAKGIDEGGVIGSNGSGSGRVCAAVLLRNAAHLLPDFVAGIESQDYPRDLVGLRFYTDGNFDSTGAALEDAKPGLLEKGYESVTIWRGHDLHEDYEGRYSDGSWFTERDDCSVAPHCFNTNRLQHMMWLRNMALSDCRQTGAEFFFSLDADVLLTNPRALSIIVREARDRRGIVAPLIHSVEAPKSANFWAAVSSTGYYEHSDSYDDIVLYQQRGTHPVPLVNSAYVVHLPSVDSDSSAASANGIGAAQDKDDKPPELLSYSPVEDGSTPPIYDDIIAFGANARSRSVPQFVTNERVFGFMAHFVGAERKSHADDVAAWGRFRNEVLGTDNPESEFLLRYVLTMASSSDKSSNGGTAKNAACPDLPPHWNNDPPSGGDEGLIDRRAKALCDLLGGKPDSDPAALAAASAPLSRHRIKIDDERDVIAEVISEEPQITVFRNFLSSDEANALMEAAQPKLDTSLVVNPNTGQLTNATYRSSQVAWIGDDDVGGDGNAIAAAISRRITDVTGLNVSSAEDLQTAYYEAGGKYDSHFDWGNIVGSCRSVNRNFHYSAYVSGARLATVLMYLKDVESGGGTVFPEIGKGVRPRAGTAVLWYNLLPNSSGDVLTKHAACKVGDGSTKWIATKWIHEGGNEKPRVRHDWGPPVPDV